MPKSKPLPDRILDALSSLDAPTVSQMAEYINFDISRVRAAYDALEAEGRAKIVRRGKGLHLVPADSPVRPCLICRAEVRSKHQHVLTCSKSCGMRVAWQKRDRAKQGEVFKETHKRHPEMRKAFSVLRDDPVHKARVAERNRKDWADPVHKMKRRVAMEAAWQGPEAAPRKAKARDKTLALWSDPEWSERTRQAMLTGKRGRFQRAAIQLVSDGASDEEIAFKTGRTMEQTKTLLRRLFKQGKISRAPADGRKNRQSEAVIANRVSKTIALRAARRASA